MACIRLFNYWTESFRVACIRLFKYWTEFLLPLNTEDGKSGWRWVARQWHLHLYVTNSSKGMTMQKAVPKRSGGTTVYLKTIGDAVWYLIYEKELDQDKCNQQPCCTAYLILFWNVARLIRDMYILAFFFKGAQYKCECAQRASWKLRSCPSAAWYPDWSLLVALIPACYSHFVAGLSLAESLQLATHHWEEPEADS